MIGSRNPEQSVLVSMMLKCLLNHSLADTQLWSILLSYLSDRYACALCDGVMTQGAKQLG